MIPKTWDQVEAYGAWVLVEGGSWEERSWRVETNSRQKVTARRVAWTVKRNVAEELGYSDDMVRVRRAWFR